MTKITDLTTKVTNGGTSERGRLSADEYNTLLSAVQSHEESIASLEESTIKNCGYFLTLEALQQAYPKAGAGSKAFVGANYPYAIYLWDDSASAWVDSGATGGEETVKLEDYYTKENVDEKVAELESEVSPLMTEKVDYTEYKGKFISTTLEWITSSSPVAYSSPILVKRGERMNAKLTGSTSMCVMAKADADGNLLDKLYLGNNSEENYLYEAHEDSYIVICYYYTTEYDIVKTSLLSNIYNKIDNAVDAFNNTMEKYELQPAITQGFFINSSLQPQATSGTFCYTEPILVKAYSTLIAKIYSSSISISLAKSDEYGNLLEAIRKGNGEEQEIHYTPQEDTYVVMSYNWYYDAAFSVVNYLSDELAKMANSINTATKDNGISEIFAFKEIHPIENNGKFFTYDGNILTTSQPFCITEPIKLEAGDAILITASSSAICSLVTEVTKEGDFIKSLVVGDNNEISKGFIAPSPMYVSLSYNYDNSKKITLGTTRGRGYVASIISMTDLEDRYYDYAQKAYFAGNGIWKSKTIEIADNAMITFGTQSPVVSSNTALLTFLNAEGDYITHVKGFSQTSLRLDGSITAPFGTRYIVVQNTSAYINQTTIIISTPTTTSVNDRYDTFRDLVYNYTQEGRVGVSAKLYANAVDLHIPMRKEEGLTYPFFDVNTAISQYETEDKRVLTDGLLQQCGAEISFSPEDSNYTRIVIGKDSEDIFYVAYLEAQGKNGSSAQRKLEYTADFKEFKTLWKDSTLSQGEGLIVPNIGNIKPLQIREMADGSLIVAVDFYDFSESGTDNAGNKGANSYLGYFRINAEKTSIVQCVGIDLQGKESKVIGTHEALNGYYVKAGCYDWHMSVHGSKILVSEYGSRDPLTDWGRVWYSEDNGLTWREVFRAIDHYQDGVGEETITQTHIHGVMIDTYTDNLFVIAGENNSNIFYSSDKGKIWQVIPIRRQLLDNQNLTYMQVVNGMPFKNCIIFGSDLMNFGGFLRLNRLKDGGFSELEYAYAAYPFKYAGTKYCAGGAYRRDMSTPFLMCITRENMESTESANEGLMQSHLGRIVASYDGYKFYEIWKDDTYGSHSVIVKGEQAARNFCYCTRDMTAWLCNNGNLVLKYAGREHVYLGSTDYTAGYGDFCSRVKIFKKVENLLK